MVKVPVAPPDPTLEAMNAALQAKSAREHRRPYLGMSSIGRPCDREIWYGFRWAKRVIFDVLSLKRFADGFAQEEVMAARLRMVPGVTLMTVRPEDGRQIGYQDFGGHFRGHMDGHIEGILQAPKTPHVWEHKSVNEKKFGELKKLVLTLGEKNALREWDTTYYVQHVTYMDYGGYTRGYMTVTTPGGRDETSVRTNADVETAARAKAKAERIIFSEQAPERISEDRTFFQCKWCAHTDICHGAEAADRNCRTCLSSTAQPDGTWTCDKFKVVLTPEQQEQGCTAQRYNPAFVPGSVTAGSEAENWVEYRMPDGAVWRDEGEQPKQETAA